MELTAAGVHLVPACFVSPKLQSAPTQIKLRALYVASRSSLGLTEFTLVHNVFSFHACKLAALIRFFA
jgi:hypothetical protein